MNWLPITARHELYMKSLKTLLIMKRTLSLDVLMFPKVEQEELGVMLNITLKFATSNGKTPVET